ANVTQISNKQLTDVLAEFEQEAEQFAALNINANDYLRSVLVKVNRPGFPGECFICELRLPDHRFRWKHNKLFLLLPEEYGPAFPA
ncbi:hypothetical protein MOQ33_32230, partial [Escherichia coli]|nr:hypothetical protein [Escherichia coli]